MCQVLFQALGIENSTDKNSLPQGAYIPVLGKAEYT